MEKQTNRYNLLLLTTPYISFYAPSSTTQVFTILYYTFLEIEQLLILETEHLPVSNNHLREASGAAESSDEHIGAYVS